MTTALTMFKPLNTVVRLAMLCVLLSISAPSQSANQPYPHQLKQWDSLSRDTRVISFATTDAPFVQEDIVGGEHTSEVVVLGFPGDIFQIELTDLEGETYLGIQEEGLQRVRPKPGRPNTQWVAVPDSPALFTVYLNAHPVARYRLTISKLTERLE